MNFFTIVLISGGIIGIIELLIKGIKYLSNRKKKDSPQVSPKPAKNPIENNAHIILDMGGKIIPMSKNEVDESIFKINDLLKAHLDNVLEAQLSNVIAANYIKSIKDFILTEISIKSSEKYLQLLSDHVKHTFAVRFGSDLDNSVFYVVLYPSSKNIIKLQNFNESYLNELNNICEKLFRQLNLSIDQFKNSTFVHIMFFISNGKIEVDMGIQSIKYNFGHAPLDLLSQNDRISTGL